MTLPFLKLAQRKDDGTAITYRTPDEKAERSDEEAHMEAVESAAEDIIQAIRQGDHKMLARALKDAFDILDMMPHEEGPHTDE